MPREPFLAGDFSLIPLPERLAWRDALACHLLDKMSLPAWKREEQVAAMNCTIGCLVDQGLTEPTAIEEQVFNIGTS